MDYMMLLLHRLVVCCNIQQDPKIEVLYHIRTFFVGIFPYKAFYKPFIGLIYDRYLQWSFLKGPLI